MNDNAVKNLYHCNCRVLAPLELQAESLTPVTKLNLFQSALNCSISLIQQGGPFGCKNVFTD